MRRHRATIFTMNIFRQTSATVKTVIIRHVPTTVLQRYLYDAGTHETDTRRVFCHVVLNRSSIMLFRYLQRHRTGCIFRVAIRWPHTVRLTRGASGAADAIGVFRVMFLNTQHGFARLQCFTKRLVSVARNRISFHFLHHHR